MAKRPAGDIHLEAQAEARIEKLQTTNALLLRRLDAAKHTTHQLVEAVYKAAREAAEQIVYKPVDPPKRDQRGDDPETAIMVVSDWQLGKKTPSYSTDVCAKRVARYSNRVRRLTDIQRANRPIRRGHIFLLGDLVEGELIFPGQEHRIDASLFRQVMLDGPEILGTMIRDALDYFEVVEIHDVIGNHGCGNDAMRAVTRRGLRAWDEITTDDEVMSVDDSGQTIWQRIDEVLHYDYDGEMVGVKSRDCNFLVTPEHRVVGRDVDTAAWREWRADSLRPMFRLVTGGDNRAPDVSISDEDIRLAAWCLTDAHRDKHGYWHFYQRLSRANRIELLLAGYDHARYERDRDIGAICGKTLKSCEVSVEFHVHADDSRRISALVPDRHRLPAWVWTLSARQAEVFLAEMIFTDGSIPRGTGNRCLYVSRLELREDLQALLAANGYRATATEYRPQHWRLNITRTLHTHVSPRSAVSRQKYRGVVWCLRVPNGRFFAENNGRIFLTGNSLGGPGRKHYHPESNADAMLYEATRKMLGKEKRLIWTPTYTPGERAWYKVVTIGQHNYFLFHGDQLRGGGFAGLPFYGFARAINNWGGGVIQQPFRFSFCGHWHQLTSMAINSRVLWVNGSTESDNEWLREELKAQAPPGQWLLFAHDRRGVTSEHRVWLN